MSDLKTRPTARSVAAFLRGVRDAARRRDCRTVLRIMGRATRARPKMWGPSVVGFGTYRYRYGSGREGAWFLTGFSPRKDALTLYIMAGFPQHAALMKRLGTYKTGKACLYLKRLADVDLKVLERLVARSVRYMARLSA